MSYLTIIFPDRDGWKSIGPDMPATAYSHCMALLNETTALVVGGYVGINAISDFMFQFKYY